jgi:hypothetical protein
VDVGRRRGDCLGRSFRKFFLATNRGDIGQIGLEIVNFDRAAHLLGAGRQENPVSRRIGKLSDIGGSQHTVRRGIVVGISLVAVNARIGQVRTNFGNAGRDGSVFGINDSQNVEEVFAITRRGVECASSRRHDFGSFLVLRLI